jgi:cobalamin-dependent methionine synthase I
MCTIHLTDEEHKLLGTAINRMVNDLEKMKREAGILPLEIRKAAENSLETYYKLWSKVDQTVLYTPE